MKYSIIFPYRDREEHLRISIPAIREQVNRLGIDAELIIVEQSDTHKFRRASTKNLGAIVARPDTNIFVFHDIDYMPTDSVIYHNEVSDVYLPVQRVEFLTQALTPKPIADVPGGYRHFAQGVDANFFGGVAAITREAFQKMGGFNWKMKGWGREDEAFRDACYAEQLSVARGNGLFYALDHVDSGPDIQTDADFQQNIAMSNQWQQFRQFNVTNQPHTFTRVTPKHPLVDVWVEATDFDGPTNIVASSFLFDS